MLRGGEGNDTLSGAGGVDLLDFSDATGSISFTLTQSSVLTSTGSLGGIGTDFYKDMEGVIGSNFGDTLVGSGNNLVGDVIIGGGGKDTMTGNAGADTFVFKAVSESGTGPNSDIITDFKTSGLTSSTCSASTLIQAFLVIRLSRSLVPKMGMQWRTALLGSSRWKHDTPRRREWRYDCRFEILVNGTTPLTAADFILESLAGKGRRSNGQQRSRGCSAGRGEGWRPPKRTTFAYDCFSHDRAGLAVPETITLLPAFRSRSFSKPLSNKAGHGPSVPPLFATTARGRIVQPPG